MAIIQSKYPTWFGEAMEMHVALVLAWLWPFANVLASPATLVLAHGPWLPLIFLIIVVIPIALMFIVVASLVTIFASRLGSFLRIIAAVLLISVGLFCVYGFVAFGTDDRSFQIFWRVLFSAVGLPCLIAIVRLFTAKTRTE